MLGRGSRNGGRWFRDNLTAITLRTILLAMLRQARLDAPDTLHHVMVRGIERTTIFRDDPDRTDFLGRLAALADQGALTIYAWALRVASLLPQAARQPAPEIASV